MSRLTKSMFMLIVVGMAVAVIVEIDAGDEFCLTDLESDHGGDRLKIKAMSAFFGDSEAIVAKVLRVYPDNVCS